MLCSQETNTAQAGIISRKQYIYLNLVFLLSGMYLKTNSRISYIYFFVCSYVHRATISLPPVISIHTPAPETIPPIPVCLFLLHTARPEFLGMACWPGATKVHIRALESSSADNELDLSRNILLNSV